MRLLKPKLLALDSSQLGNLAHDMSSSDAARVYNAMSCMGSLDEQGYVLVLSFHHIQELLSHDNEDRLSERLSYLRSLPMVASVASLHGDETIGSIVDVQLREVSAAYENSAMDALAIRERVAPHVFRFCSGADLVRPVVENWSSLRAAFAEQIVKNGERVAILRSNFANLSNVKIVDLLRGAVRSPREISEQLAGLHERLSDDMTQRGDKRIRDAPQAAALFLEEVKRRGIAALDHVNPVVGILTMHDVSLHEVGPETTIADVGVLGAFRNKLRVLNRTLGLPWSEVRARINEQRLPSGIIQAALGKYHPDTREWDGSELTDRHLACLSAYADVTYVDRRIHEAFRQARRKVSKFAAVTRRVEKAGNYEQVAAHLKRS